MDSACDVIVIGAGPGGSAAAHFLSRAGLRVLLLDKHLFPRNKTCGDGLSPRALAVIQDMGALETILPASQQVTRVEIISPNGQPIVAPVPGWDGQPGYGLVTPRLVLDEALRRQALRSGATFHGKVHVTGIEVEADGVLVRGRAGRQPVTYRAAAVVLATGASYRLLLRAGLLSAPPTVMLAARAYFDNVPAPSDRFRFHLDGVPLPGYGWVFPLSASSANVGAGFFRAGRRAARMPDSARQVFQAFVHHAPVRRLLAGATQRGPLEGFPLLVGFPGMPTARERLLVVGEAAGLVNPLTGEGIDYALESGRLAAGVLAAAFARGDLSRPALEGYGAELQRRFGAQFALCTRIRDAFMNPTMLDTIIRLGNLRPAFKMTIIRVALGLERVPQGAGVGWVLKSLFSSHPAD